MNYFEQIEQLGIFDYRFRILDHEFCADQDEPHKSNFQHPWRSWAGVEIRYFFIEHTCTILGSRGKWVWYIPNRQREHVGVLGFDKGLGIKIAKFRNTPDRSYSHLLKEIVIQNEFADLNLAPRVLSVVRVRNLEPNRVMWFDRELDFASGSIHLAMIMEDVIAEEMPRAEIRLTQNYLYEGPIIDRIRSICVEKGIRPHDLGLGNLFYTSAGWRIVDFHHWGRR